MKVIGIYVVQHGEGLDVKLWFEFFNNIQKDHAIYLIIKQWNAFPVYLNVKSLLPISWREAEEIGKYDGKNERKRECAA